MKWTLNLYVLNADFSKARQIFCAQTENFQFRDYQLGSEGIYTEWEQVPYDQAPTQDTSKLWAPKTLV